MGGFSKKFQPTSDSTPYSVLCKILMALTGAPGDNGIAGAIGGGGSPSSFGSAANIAVVTAGTRVQGSSLSTPKGVVVVAYPGNTGNVYVGGSGVTNSGGTQIGVPLVQGGFSPVLPVQNLNEVYVDADNNGDKVGVIVL